MISSIAPDVDNDTLVQCQFPEIDKQNYLTPWIRSRVAAVGCRQRPAAEAAFLRHFMAWVEEQAKERGIGVEVLARRLRMPRGVIVRHFRVPEAMPLRHIVSYQMALGLCMDFIPLPITRLSEMPGYKPS